MKKIITLGFCIFLIWNNPMSRGPENVNALGNCSQTKRLNSLPGTGWDLLRNKGMSQVFKFHYNDCNTTPDGKYLIPDNCQAYPFSTSDIKSNSEVIKDWRKFDSLTSLSMKLGVDTTIEEVIPVSMSFSSEVRDLKKSQIEQDSITTRVQARYKLYTVNCHSNAGFSSYFNHMLSRAIKAIKENDSNRVKYAVELVVRTFGTHALTWIDSGAIIFHEEFVSREYTESTNLTVLELKRSASAGFKDIFKIESSLHFSHGNIRDEGYTRNITSSRTKTIGGMLWHHSPNTSIQSWINSIEDNLVPIDRFGDPLHFFITDSAFPQEDPEVVMKLKTELYEAISRYYAYNTRIGCMNSKFNTFDYTANVGREESCIDEDLQDNFAFGGVYQKCPSNGNRCCEKHLLKNFVTGCATCPENFSPILLKISHDKVCGWFGRCSLCQYETYWCAGLYPVTRNSSNLRYGVKFGGVYTDSRSNLFTERKNCPPEFLNVTVLESLKICIGKYKGGEDFDIGLGGFFSCQQGNPLRIRTSNSTSALSIHQDDLHQTSSKECPRGYTENTATIHQDCFISYCVKAGSRLNEHKEQQIILPPFDTVRAKPVDNSSRLPDLRLESGLMGPSLYIGAIRGENAFAGEFPHQIFMVVNNGREESYCGGSILSKNKIATTAHCCEGFEAKDIVIIAGTLSLKNEEYYQQTAQVIQVIIHPKYNLSSTLDYDACKLILKSNLNLNHRVSTIRLCENEPKTGSCTASGWGLTSNSYNRIPNLLQKRTMSIVPREICALSHANSPYGYNVTNAMFCTGDTEGQRACFGDSGGPLVCESSGKCLAGITSWKDEICGKLGYPDVFVNVAKEDIRHFFLKD